jgi:hypothetical protein
MTVRGIDHWAQVECGPRRVLPALPGADADMGEIRWDRWERHVVVTHIDPSCGTCGYGGPLACARGQTLWQDRPRRTLLRPSKVAEGRRPVWGPPLAPEPRWVITHHATRCQRCDEMFVWCAYGVRPRCEECAAVSPAELRDKLAQCPACLRRCWHLVPGRLGQGPQTKIKRRYETWVEIAYNPPRTEAVAPARRGRRAPQEDALF